MARVTVKYFGQVDVRRRWMAGARGACEQCAAWSLAGWHDAVASGSADRSAAAATLAGHGGAVLGLRVGNRLLTASESRSRRATGGRGRAAARQRGPVCRGAARRGQVRGRGRWTSGIWQAAAGWADVGPWRRECGRAGEPGDGVGPRGVRLWRARRGACRWGAKPGDSGPGLDPHPR